MILFIYQTLKEFPSYFICADNPAHEQTGRTEWHGYITGSVSSIINDTDKVVKKQRT